MKRLFLLLIIASCSKPNDLPALREDAEAGIKYYTPKLDAATVRIQRVLQLSGKVPKDLPGSDEALRALVDARDKLVEMRKISKDVEAALATLTTEDKRPDLERLVEHEEHQYEEGLAFVNENINEVESWVSNQLRTPHAAPAASTEPAKDVPEGVIP